MPAKRYTWELAEARAWLKRERPKVYEGLCDKVAKQGETARDRQRLLDAVIGELMPWAFARAWDDIEARASQIFPPKSKSQTRTIARKIARNARP